jgi:hypothetical protein
MLARDYKIKFSLDVSKGLLDPELKELKAKKAIENKTYLNLINGTPNRYSKENPPHNYKRSNQSMERLRAQWTHWTTVTNKPIVKKIIITCALANCDKEKEIYPRYFKKGNNYCSITHRNIGLNNNKKNI